MNASCSSKQSPGLRAPIRDLNPPHLDSNHLSAVGASSDRHRAWDYWDYPSSCSRVARKQLSPPRAHRSDSHPDGEDLDVPDLELARKKKQLRDIEERIIHKQASLVRNSILSVDGNEVSVPRRAATLRDRVMDILQQKHSATFFTKTQSPQEKPKSAHLTQDLHPLKLRVKALMKQRRDGAALPTHRQEVSRVQRVPDLPDVLPAPPTSPANRENAVSKGFERFLSLLNKGVDIDYLSQIVNGDTDDPLANGPTLSAPSPVVQIEPSPPIRSQSRRLSSDDVSRRTTEETKSGRRGRRPSYSSRSRSPAPQTKKQKKKEEEEEEEQQKLQMEDKNQQLQNIVQTLGLNLKVEELSRLSDRTQERLYGKTSDGQQRTDSYQRSSHREYSRSASSSSSASSSASSSSSRSSSRSSTSRSPSPCHDPGPRDRGSERRPEHLGEGRTDGAMFGEQVASDYQYMLDYQHLEAQTNPYLYSPSAKAAYPHPYYPELQYYQSVGSTSVQAQYPYLPADSSSSSVHLSIPEQLAPWWRDTPSTRHEHVKDLVMLINPNLAESEGQYGNVSDNRCLKFINTEKTSVKRCLTTVTEMKRSRRGANSTKRRNHKYEAFLKKKATQRFLVETSEAMANALSQVTAQRMEASHPGEHSEASEDEKRQPTKNNRRQPTENERRQLTKNERRQLSEEEIKVNLRKKLEVFNQRAKLHHRESAFSSSSSSSKQPDPLMPPTE